MRSSYFTFQKPDFERTEIETIKENEERPQPTTISEASVESEDSDSYTMDCTGTTGIKINVDTREMKRKITEQRENFRKSLSWTPSSSEGDSRGARSFEAGIKLGVRPKTEEEIFDKLREEERTEAVRKQQKKELFRLNEKTMEWVPPESAAQTEDNSYENQHNQTLHDADCLQSFCLYLKLQLSQFSHFSVRTVSPDFDDAQKDDEAERHPVAEEAEMEPLETNQPDQESPPPVRSKESRNLKQNKRRDSGIYFGFGTKRPRKKSVDSQSPLEEIVEDEKVYEVSDEQLVEQIEEQSDTKLESETESSSVNFIEDFWETTKEAYGVQKSGAEVVIDKTRKGVSEGASTAVDKTLEIKDRTLERTKEAANDVYETSAEIKDVTIERTKKGATAVVDKTVEGTNLVVDKTLESANVIVDTTIKGTEVVVDKTVEGATAAFDKTVEIANKTVFVVDDATKDVNVHPFGKRQSPKSDENDASKNDLEGDIVVANDENDVRNLEEEKINEDERSLQGQAETKQLQEEIPVKSEKKKRRKSSVISFGFSNKNKRRDSTKSLKGSSRTSSRTSLQMETVPEMEVVEEKEEPVSERSEPVSRKSEPISQTKLEEESVKSLGSKSSNSSNIIESFIVTTKEAFGTTKVGAEKVIDKTVEVKNSLFERKERENNPKCDQEEASHHSQTDKVYVNVSKNSHHDNGTVPTGDAHLQRLWRTITGENRFDNEQGSDNEFEVTNDYENLPRSNHHYGYRKEDSYTVPETVSTTTNIHSLTIVFFRKGRTSARF